MPIESHTHEGVDCDGAPITVIPVYTPKEYVEAGQKLMRELFEKQQAENKTL